MGIKSVESFLIPDFYGRWERHKTIPDFYGRWEWHKNGNHVTGVVQQIKTSYSSEEKPFSVKIFYQGVLGSPSRQPNIMQKVVYMPSEDEVCNLAEKIEKIRNATINHPASRKEQWIRGFNWMDRVPMFEELFAEDPDDKLGNVFESI